MNAIKRTKGLGRGLEALLGPSGDDANKDMGEQVMTLRKQIDAVVRSVLTDGTERGEFDVDDIPRTALALLSLCVDVARWYQPGISRTPQEIGETNGRLGLRLVAAL